jgi:hypothetical protein
VVPAFDFVPESAEPSHEDGVATIPKRPARRRKNTAWELTKIIGGAVLAIPLAQVILWLLPGGRDLPVVGPSMRRVVGWASSAEEDTLGESAGAKTRSSAPRTLPIIEPRKAKSGLRANSGSSKLDNRTADSFDAPEGPVTASVDNGTNGRRNQVPKQRTARGDTEATKSVADASVAPDPSASPAPDPPPTTEGALVKRVKDSPEYETKDLRQALERAIQASAAWDTAPDQTPEARAELTDQFYMAFAELGETVTFVHPGDPAARVLAQSMRDLLATFGRQPRKLAMIGNRTFDWLEQEDRPNSGVFLFGTVKQIAPIGEVFETELELASRNKRLVKIISPFDPTPFYRPRDHLLMLGAIVIDPATNLVGYNGDSPMVVMGSFPVPIKM